MKLTFSGLSSSRNSGSVSFRHIAATSALSLLAVVGVFSNLRSEAFAETVSKREIRGEEVEHEEESQPSKIQRVGKGGVFTPSVINISVFQPVTFELVAVDKDYTFDVGRTPLKFKVKKGSVTEISLGSLGKGDFTFSCGPKCAGTIHVAPEYDDDDEE